MNLESIELTPGDTTVFSKDGRQKGVKLVSREIMVLEKESGRVFSPVRIQSCMHPEQVRIEPVEIFCMENEKILIRDISGEHWFEEKEIEIHFRTWTPQIPDGHCGDCTKCRRCWA